MTPLLMLAAFALSADPPPAVAFVLEVQGTAKVERDGKSLALDDGDPLQKGDKLTLLAGGGLKIYFKPSGPVAVIEGPADAVVMPDKLETTAKVTIRDTKLGGKAAEGLDKEVKTSLIGGLTLRSLPPLPDPPTIRPVVGSSLVDAKPTFSWPAIEGAKEYRFEMLSGPPGKKQETLWEVTTKVPRLEYPKKQMPLERGNDSDYRWNVTAIGADGTERPTVTIGRFKVLDEATVKDLSQLATFSNSEEPSDWLLAAESYAGWGLHDEPLALYAKYAAKRPGSARVWKVLARYYDQAGRIDEAKKAKAEAEKLGGGK